MMSSETSTSRRPVDAGHYDGLVADGLIAPKPDRVEADALQPWQLFTLAGLIGATIVVFLSRGQSPIGIVLLSCAIFAAAYVGLMALRTFLPFTGRLPEESAEILGGRTRAALEREKALVLRTIKELEFDRGMGKVSERDFAEMSARLRARAARLMRQLDAGSVYRVEIEREIERRLAAIPPAPQSSTASAAGATEAARPATSAATSGDRICPACDAGNDADARFCKSCGAKMEAGS
jgi:hypothetical protein